MLDIASGMHDDKQSDTFVLNVEKSLDKPKSGNKSAKNKTTISLDMNLLPEKNEENFDLNLIGE